MEKKLHIRWAQADIVAKILGVILVPIIIIVIGQRFENDRQLSFENRKRAEESRLKNERLAHLSSQLNSTNKLERLFALRLLKLNSKKDFPVQFIDPLQDMVYRDDMEIAKEAHSILVSLGVSMDEIISDQRKHLEFLKPLIINFIRTKRAFLEWDSCQETEIIRKANQYSYDVLLREDKIIKKLGLAEASAKLIKHYKAWLAEYNRIKRSGGDLCNPVYVGPLGFPFPRESEKAFIAKFNKFQME